MTDLSPSRLGARTTIRALYFTHMQAIKDLFNIDRYVGKKGKVIDERAGLIGYFGEKVGKDPKLVGVRLAHYNLDQLYGLKSLFEDRLTRNSKTTAVKWFWWITRTRSLTEK